MNIQNSLRDIGRHWAGRHSLNVNEHDLPLVGQYMYVDSCDIV